jgi:hypothetical protein
MEELEIGNLPPRNRDFIPSVLIKYNIFAAENIKIMI